LLVIGFLCNLGVRPVQERYYMTSDDLVDPREAPRRVAQRG
jgi:hypothetical protein